MDVLNKLKNTVSNTISNTVNNTAYGLSQLSSVLPGNPVTREFEVTAHIASAGPGLLWKVYSGFKKSTRQEAAIFVLEKRSLERLSNKSDREAVLECLRRGIAQLTKLRHPQVLTVQHPLEESRDSLAFATEPVFASLANVLGKTDNVPQLLASKLENYKLHDIEIRYGLLQLGEGLAFLHADVKLLHGNLCPESIIVNSHGAWKIFGFDFSVLNKSDSAKAPSWPYKEYDPTFPTIGQPSLDYQAPECILASSNGPPSDMFSLGMLAFALHAVNYKPLYESHGDLSKCRQNLGQLKNSLSSNAKFSHLPDSLRETVKLMLSNNQELRPDAHQFIKIDYFMVIGVKTLNYLDKLFQWDNLQKSQFYKGLPEVIKQMPHRVVVHRVLPALYKEFVNAPMIPFVLPTILQVLEESNVEEFREHILPNLKPVFALDDPPQITFVLMQRINLLLKLCPDDVIKGDIVPMITRALDSRWEQLQELCLTALPSIAPLIEGPVMKNTILPRVMKLCVRSKENNASLGLRVNCLLCLAKMIENFDRWLVFDQIIPFLQQVPSNNEPAMIMAVIGIYKMILTHSKLGISKEILATKVLPSLLPLCIEQCLSPSQFETLAALVSDMVNQVTAEHRQALKQLDAVRRETQQFDQALTQTIESPTVAALTQAFGGTESHSTFHEATSPSKSIESDMGLTMQDKHRLARQQEAQQRLQSQSPLMPKTAVQPMKLKPKDLTDTLLQSNLSQLNLSNSSKKANYTWNNAPHNPSQLMSPPNPSANSWATSNQTNGLTWGQMAPQQSNQTQLSWNPSPMTNNTQFKPATSPMGAMQQSFNPQSNAQTNPTTTTNPNLSTQDIMDLLS